MINVTCKYGEFTVSQEPGKGNSCYDTIVVRHAGELQLEVEDVVLRERVLRLALYDLSIRDGGVAFDLLSK